MDNLPIPKGIAKKDKINLWLNKKINDKEIPSKYSLENYFLEYEPILSNDNYYTNDDTDIKNTDKFLANNYDDIMDGKLKKYLDEFEDEKILIFPNTNRYQCNQLLKELIDTCKIFKMEYKIVNNEGDEFEKRSLISKEFKDLFYEFCFDNSI